MSSRALRKLRREEEERRQIAVLEADESDEIDSDRAVESAADPVPTKSKLNAFVMLEGVEDDEETDGEKDDESEVHDPPRLVFDSPEAISIASKTTQAKKKQKKKQKQKGKSRPPGGSGDGANKGAVEAREPNMDEIDRALQQLALQSGLGPAHTERTLEVAGEAESWEIEATVLLAIDSKALNPVNEMKSLFGSIALEGSSDTRQSSRNPRRRDQNQQGGVDLATALTGRYNPASKGKDLGALASRRNVFLQGREEWPLATSGGLSMEYLGTKNHFERHFNIQHSNVYEDTQRQFRMVVDSMQPEMMIQHLQLNPYHIATLLQVSEIAKHQGDHSVSGDLLERALFSFGRSVHSAFPAALREGTARLAFERPPNRELYLTIWRYVQNLSMRGTWRTAYEWAKVIFQFDTLADPYGMTLMIDQLAIRGRQYTSLINLCSENAYKSSWAHLPNMKMSLALAYSRNSQPRLARENLAIALHQYPYIVSALASALDISPLPKRLWGALPTTNAEKLYTELYVSRAKDLWNTPESTALIAEVADTMSHYESVTNAAPPAAKLEISLEEARHIMLLEVPSLIALLPRKFTTLPTSSSDVLPPPPRDSPHTFTSRPPATAAAPSTPGSGGSIVQALFDAANVVRGGPITAASGVFSRVLNWFGRPAGQGGEDPVNADGETEGVAAFRELGEHLGGASPEMVQELVRIVVMSSEDQDGRIATGASSDRPGGGGLSAWPRQDEDDHGGADDDANENDSIPDLESNPASDNGTGIHAMEEAPMVQGPIQRSLAATVEDDPAASSDDDDDDDGVRSAESMAPTPPRPHPEPSHLIYARNTPPGAATSAPEPPGSNDPQRLQRWLLSTGLQDLQDQKVSLSEYVSRLNALRQRDRDWTLGIVKQRAGAEVADAIRTRVLG